MATLSKTANDFVVNQGLALKNGATTARFISYAGNPTGATIVPTPTPGTVCIDSTTGTMYQFVSGTSWNQYTTGAPIASMDWKNSARVATTVNIANVLTAAPNIVDGVTLLAGDRVLVRAQTTASSNGIYTVTTVGTGANGVWARSSDANSGANLNAGALIQVEAGTTYASTVWMMTTPGTVTIDTTALTWVNFGTYTAGSGINITNGVITAVADPNGGLAVTGVGIKAVSSNNGILVNSSGIGAVVDATGGLQIGASGLKTLSANAAITVSGSGLTFVADPAGALSIGGSGVKVLSANAGIAVSGTGIGLVVDPAGALTIGGSGAKVNVDTTNNSTAIVGNTVIIPGALQKTIASATATQIVDTVPIATYASACWTVVVKNATTGRYCSSINAVNLGTGITVDYTEFGTVVVGTFTTNLPTFTVTSDGTNMILTFVGDATNSISVSRDAI